MMYSFGPYVLDPSLPLLTLDGRTVAIPPRAHTALLLLLERRHTACSRAELIGAVWPDSFVEEGSLAQLISTLRKALAPGFPDSSPIQTLSKVGYRFVAEVREHAAPPLAVGVDEAVVPPLGNSAESLSAPALEDPAHSSASWWQHGSRAAAICVGLLLITLSAVGLARYRQAHRSVTPAASRTAVAVLPFRDRAANVGDAWVGVAIQEMLATDLRLSTTARVLPTDEVQRAALESHAETPDLSAAAMSNLRRDLDCEYAVAGTYSVREGRIELRLNVFNLATGTKSQERLYERPESAFLPMLAEAGLQAGRDLGTPVVDNGKAYALANGLRPDMYELYAKGVAANRIYDGKDAVPFLQRALALEPTFPLTHLELSAAWSSLGEEAKAADEAKQAMQLSGQLTREQQLLIQSRVQSTSHQFAAAAETFRALYRFYPENLEYGRLLIQALSNAGKSEEALAEAQSILHANGAHPADPLLFSVVADMYSTRGEWAKSLEWASRGVEQSRQRGATILYERLLTTESQAMLHLGQLGDADAKTSEALALARQYHDVSGELRALNRTGEIATAQHDLPRATVALLSALELERSHDQLQRETHTLLTLSRLSQAQDNLPMSLAYSERATELAKQIGFAEVMTEAKLQAATVKAAMGSRKDAAVLFAEVSQEAADIHDSYLQHAAQQAMLALNHVN